jgi:thiaminase/transcriptional activator TenA
MAEQFTAQLWARISPLYRAILDHPFLHGLTDGTLPEETFRVYVTQDALYLRQFARVLAVAAAKAPRDDWCEVLSEHAKVTLVVERSLHEGFFQGWGLPVEQIERTPPTPTTLAYTSYLNRVAYSSPFEEILGAVLPCYWIYWEVGKALETRGSSQRLYQRWIDTYASEMFASAVQQVLTMLDTAVSDLPPRRLAAIEERFVTAARYEWMFWDAAWRQEQWPIEA